MGIDATLEPETSMPGTVETAEASAPPTIVGADNLACDAGTERRDPDSGECAEREAHVRNSPSVAQIGITSRFARKRSRPRR